MFAARRVTANSEDADISSVDVVSIVLLFFFQAEDGIRDYKVTGVQTCALPICLLCRTGGSSQRLHHLEKLPARPLVGNRVIKPNQRERLRAFHQLAPLAFLRVEDRKSVV